MHLKNFIRIYGFLFTHFLINSQIFPPPDLENSYFVCCFLFVRHVCFSTNLYSFSFGFLLFNRKEEKKSSKSFFFNKNICFNEICLMHSIICSSLSVETLWFNGVREIKLSKCVLSCSAQLLLSDCRWIGRPLCVFFLFQFGYEREHIFVWCVRFLMNVQMRFRLNGVLFSFFLFYIDSFPFYHSKAQRHTTLQPVTFFILLYSDHATSGGGIIFPLPSIPFHLVFFSLFYFVYIPASFFLYS